MYHMHNVQDNCSSVASCIRRSRRVDATRCASRRRRDAREDREEKSTVSDSESSQPGSDP